MGQVEHSSPRISVKASDACARRFSPSFQSEISRLVTAALSKNTRANFDAGIAAFEQFRTSMNYAYVWHAPFNHIVEFISDLSINGCSYRTVHCRLSAISYFNKVYDLHDCTKNFIVRKMLGLRRIRRSEDTRYPISLDLLWHIVSNLRYVCHSIYETSFFVSIFRFDASQWIHFHEFRRTWSVLLFNDIHYDQHSVRLQLRVSKNDQFGLGSTSNIKLIQKIIFYYNI